MPNDFDPSQQPQHPEFSNGDVEPTETTNQRLLDTLEQKAKLGHHQVAMPELTKLPGELGVLARLNGLDHERFMATLEAGDGTNREIDVFWKPVNDRPDRVAGHCNVKERLEDGSNHVANYMVTSDVGGLRISKYESVQPDDPLKKFGQVPVEAVLGTILSQGIENAVSMQEEEIAGLSAITDNEAQSLIDLIANGHYLPIT